MSTGNRPPQTVDTTPRSTPRRSSVLQLSTRIVLSRSGLQFFTRNNKTVNRFHSPGSEAEYGIALNSFTAASVQRMIQLGFVYRIEVAPTGHVSGQEDLIDLSKLLVYAMLYFQFDSRVNDEVFESDLIVRWNRKHLRNPISRDTPVYDERLKQLISQNEKVTADIWNEILNPIAEQIRMDPDLRPEERQIHVYTAEKFVKNLRPFIWFLLAQFRGSSEYLALAGSIRQILQQFRRQTGIAEYTALVTREIVANAQNINMQNYVTENYPNAWEPSRVLSDRIVRDRMLSEMELKEKLVRVSWTLSSRNSETPGLNNLRIIVQNEQPESLDIPSPDHDRTIYDRRKSLREYYAEIPESVTNTELALYYYSYLTEACRTRGIRFESAVHDSRTAGTTVVSLSFQF